MAAVAVVIVGLGIFLVYEAYKSPTPTPVTTAKAAVS
jgi:hypothetical protein